MSFVDPPVDKTTTNVVLKPGFYNRRVEGSQHLKNSFPGGFKRLQCGTQSLPSLTMKPNESLASGSDSHHPTISYMSWAKGSQANYNDDMLEESHFGSSCKPVTDPLAVMAGPYYSD